MTSLSLTREGLQAEMDEWAVIAAKAKRAGFKITNPHPIKKGW